MDAQDQLRQALTKHLQTTTYAQLATKMGLSTSILHHFLYQGRRIRLDTAITIAETIGYQIQLRKKHKT